MQQGYVLVTVRHIRQGEGTPLGWFRPGDIEPLVALFRKYGAVAEGYDHAPFAGAQWDMDVPTFEIIVGEDDD